MECFKTNMIHDRLPERRLPGLYPDALGLRIFLSSSAL